MLAYEFEAVVENGVITIPAEYARMVPAKVKVIIMPEKEHTVDKASFFPDLQLLTGTYRFNREELHER